MSRLRFSSVKPLEWIAGAILGGMLLPWTINEVREWFPPAEPIRMVVSTSGLQPDGLWRVERTIEIRETCGSVVYRRAFRGQIDGISVPDLLGPAVSSNLPAALDAVLPSRQRPPGTYRDWWTYRIPPGFVGSYIVSVAAADCPSGYNGVFTLYVVPVP